MRQAAVAMAVGIMVLAVAAGCRPKEVCKCSGGACMMSARNPNLGQVRHVVLFKFKDGTTPEQIKGIEDAFRALPKEVSEIRTFEWGTDMSVEKLAAGFTHCFFLTFDTAKDRDEYLPHPEHQLFGQKLQPILDKVLVIDYVVQD